MKSGNRWALTVGLALAASVCLDAPSSAQNTGVTARGARIAELERAGKYSEAIPLARRLLADREKAHGRVDRDVAAALNNLALLHGDLGHDADAEPLLKRALTIQEKVWGLDSAEIAPELNNLAALYQRQERYAEAEPLFKRALAIREKSLGSGHPDLGQSMNNLATLYEKQGRHADSEPLFNRSLAALDKAIVAAVSKERSKRDLASEQRARARLAEISAERARLQKVLAAEFPDYAAFVESAADDGEGDSGAVVRRPSDGCVFRCRQGELRLCDHAREF